MNQETKGPTMKMRYTTDSKIQLTMTVTDFANIQTALMVAATDLQTSNLADDLTNTLTAIKRARHIATSL